MKYFLALLALLIASKSGYAQSFNRQKLDSLFDVLEKNDRTMGSFALARNGHVLYERAIGQALADSAHHVKASPKTRYRIGSVTKMFTAAMIFQLIDQQKLTLETPLSDYYPMIPNARQITIGQMLQHRSGIFSFTEDERYTSWMEQPKSKAQMLAVMAAAGPKFPPDSMAEYSNTNYVLLGYILESVYKKPYAAILKEQIADKAGLKDTYYGGKPDIRNSEASSYAYANGWTAAPVTDMSIPGGAGAIVSTPKDLTRFISLLFTGRLVSTASLERMQQIRDGYGMGMFTIPFGPKTFYGHTGGIDGFSSIVGYNKADSFSFSYCINGTRFPVNNISIGMLSSYYNQPYALPDFKAVAVTAEPLGQYTGVYASTKLPISITITAEGNVLHAQATGQPALPLEARGAHSFAFDAAGILLKFDPAANRMTLEQSGGSFVFTRASGK